MRYILLSIFVLGAFTGMKAQTVKTHAGMQYTGSGSYTGYRDNKRDSVLFSAPMGIEVDTMGRLYVSNEHNIFWILGNTCYLAAGYILDPNEPGAADSKDFAGSQARFSRPAGLAVNPKTNEMMIADLDNNQVRKLERFINKATQQVVTTFAGVKLLNGAHLDAANSSAKFNGPAGIAVAPNGDVYIADRNNHCIRKISGGNVTTIAGSAGNAGHVNATGTAAKFSAPYNVFLDGNDLLVADYGNSAIRKINLTTMAVSDLITTGLFGPKDLCKVGSSIFIAEALCVKRYESNVLSIYVGSNSQQGYEDADGTAARFSDLTGIVYHPGDKMLYVVDMGNNVVRSISPNARPVCNFTVSTTSATKGQTIIMTSTSVNKPDYFKWTITPSNFTLLNNTTLNDSIVYVSFAQVGTYTIKLYVSNSSGPDSLTKSNHIAVSSNTAKPVVDFMASKTTPDVDEVISLIDLSANTPTKWTWRITPGNYIWMNGTDSNSKIANIKFTNGDNFTVTLIAENTEGVSSLTKTEYIKVNGTSILSVRDEKQIVAYPNPATDFINLNLSQASSIKILDAYGRVVYTLNAEAGELRIDMSQFASGAYSVIVFNNQEALTGKFILNH
ncbi:MAG TPA: T9SS type A sorting domain-containing protein [Bacteroidia bacterium]